MTSEQEQSLLAWYHAVKRELPWRRSRELYPVLVSEFMLQQTTVAAVIPLYLRWMERFPTVEALAQATGDQVMEAWSGLGYYSRARNLHRAASAVTVAGRLPETLAELRALPGLGPYTAAAVASIALGLPHLALDTNALRVLLRLYGWETRADLPQVQETLRRRVEDSLTNSDFGVTNQALMELGATLCKVRAPACLACPLAEGCQANREAIQDRIPTPKPRKAPLETTGTAYLAQADGGLLLVRGTTIGLLSDLFQPPLDFGAENRSDQPLTGLMEWLRTRARPPSVARVTYGISGRSLTVELVRVGVHEDFAPMAAELGLDFRLWKPGDTTALSSLTRKVLKVWAESRAGSQPPDDTYPVFEPVRPSRRR